MRSETLYQSILIFLGVVATVMLGIFLYQEIFPEYKIYQNAYIKLEDFRSTYTGEASPEFKEGVKQIVIPREDNGPATIDRCISCHVALQFEHFSPTKIAHDVNGNILRNAQGIPIQEPNELYVWDKLEQKISALTDEAVNKQLTEEGHTKEVQKRLKEAEELKALKVASVDDHEYDMTKVLRMHPLMGRETRPFEYHPMETYGCTSCHSGNGRSLVTDRAHGPVFDNTYEQEYIGPVPKFTESDPENDPLFAKAYNGKPGDRLLFQTTPILVNNLIQAKCVQCHLPTSKALNSAVDEVQSVSQRKTNQSQVIKKAFLHEVQDLQSLLTLYDLIESKGYDQTISVLKHTEQLDTLTDVERESLKAQQKYLLIFAHVPENTKKNDVIENLTNRITALAGSLETAQQIVKQFDNKDPDAAQKLQQFLLAQQQKGNVKGTLFDKATILSLDESLMLHVDNMQSPLKNIAKDQNTISGMESDIDMLTKTYQKGQELYLSQACYACHRISGFSRGGVGPELTQAAVNAPWYLKHHIVWPQGDLKTSTMPNMKLDHEELEALLTFLIAQNPSTNKAVAPMKVQESVKAWENGQKRVWEKPIEPTQVDDLNFAMEIFATQGCASCHRLEGFESDVGFRIEKENPTFDQLYQEHQWFQQLFPEEILGSRIVATLDKHAQEIDQHIVNDVRSHSILELIEKRHPEAIEALYTNFKYASRAKNHLFLTQAEAEKDPKKKQEILAELDQWKSRVHRLLMIYIQEYGLGRLIGPRLNWSGIFRTDEWLMEHFWNPSAHSPRSIMPAFPFDDTKFRALTHMLDVLGQRNRDKQREVWDQRGFNPQKAVQIHCAQCHGDYLQGNGPVADWIYPIPKNLRDAVFLRNLTKERAIDSITHGVRGTPMPPWGEVAEGKEMKHRTPELSETEILQIVDWLFADLPGEKAMPAKDEVLKWKYEPEDVLKEIQKEGDTRKLEIPKPAKQNPEPSAAGAMKGPFIAMINPLFLAAAVPTTAPNGEEGMDVQDVFDVVPANQPGPDKDFYYIKKKYYTDENIKQGEDLFVANCSICHGKDADGSGMRAAAMQDAKPRMLTNLDWIETRDDLRLLRSIKYGVPGTGMTPWGDYTSAWQRMELVMYIRSLSSEKKNQDNLNRAIYQSFSHVLSTIEEARGKEYVQVQETQQAYDSLQAQRESMAIQAKNGDTTSNPQLIQDYQKELLLASQLNKAKEIDDRYTNLSTLIKQQRDIFKRLGAQLIGLYGNGPAFEDYLKIVQLQQNFTSGPQGELVWKNPNQSEIQPLVQNIVKLMDERISSLESQQKAWQEKKGSEEKEKMLKDIAEEIKSHQKAKRALLSSMTEIEPLIEQQKQLYNKINDKKDSK